jgi:multidrug efflux system membrane fusion protein
MQTGIIVHALSSQKSRRLRCLTSTGVLAAILSLLTTCSKSSSPDQSQPGGLGQAAPVTVALVVQKTVPIELRAIGTVAAYNSTAVKAQVGGVITAVHFREGQHVKAGDLLFSIDSRPYANAVKQAEGILARDSAQLKNAIKEADRSKVLLQRALISQEDYDSSQANAEALKGLVQADRAGLANARLNLEYCSITAPGDGITGQRLVDPGNVLKANDAALVVINQIRPIYVNFSVPQQNLPEIREHLAQAKLPVRALISGLSEPEEGDLTLIDNAVDPATGTVLLKGTFPNRDERLWPGLFVNVVLTLAQRENALVVPSRAVQTGQQGTYVYVVKPDQTVELKLVKVAFTLDDQAVVEQGVEPGEQVVTDGQLRLVPGAKVEIKKNAEEVEAPHP